MHNPLDQFQVYNIIPLRIGDIDISLTNSSLWMLFVVGIIILFCILSTKKLSLIPGTMQSICEQSVSFVKELVLQNIGTYGPYFVPIFTLFLLLTFSNVIGLLPFAFTITAQLIVTFTLASFVFLISTLIGFYKHGIRFFSLFIPKNVPKLMVPFLFIVEFISYCFRPISLSIRLFANMVAGHIILKIFLGFSDSLGIVGGVIPLGISVFLLMFETLIAFLQAYVFTLLTCLYVKDAIHLH